jgi:uncharacterized protein (TIGR03083 family)
MAALDAYVPLVHAEADGLAQFLATLSADEWQRPSACDLWAIRDLVAHVIWAADFYTDAVSRGIHGDLSHPKDRPPGNAPALFPAMPAYIDQQARTVRDRIGTALLPTFRSRYHALAQVMARLSPQQWEMPCAFFQLRGGHRPAYAFLFAILAELAIHGWDMRSRLTRRPRSRSSAWGSSWSGVFPPSSASSHSPGIPAPSHRCGTGVTSQESVPSGMT